MINPRPGKVERDVSAASAAYLVNLLPELMTLPKAELFDALYQHFMTAFLARHEEECRRRPNLYEPGVN